VQWNGSSFQAVTSTGAPRTVTSLSFDPAHDDVVVTGSQTAATPDIGTPSDTTYVFDGSKWHAAALPAALRDWVSAAVCSDAPEDGVLLFGGVRSSGNAVSPPGVSAPAMTWRWNGDAWVDVTPQT
jgi:hypothetical protein